MNSLPLISIVTPSFNQAKYIRATIDSVLSQGYPRLEYFVIDGGSTDGTVDILKSYGDKITWVSEQDRGQTDAINKGLRRSHGEILGYLNSDDIYLPGTLHKIASYYQKNHADWMTGDCLIINEVGEINHTNWLVSGYKRLLMTLYSRTTLIIADSMLPQPSTFWSRRAYERIGEFNAAYHYVMDYDYWLRLARYYRPHDLKTALSGFRVQPESKSETSRAKLMAEGNQALKVAGASSWQLVLHNLHSAIVRAIYKVIT